MVIPQSDPTWFIIFICGKMIDELPRFGAYTLWHNPRSDQALISKGVGLDVICSHGLAKMDRFEHFLQKDPEGAYVLSLSGILSRILKFGRQWNEQLWRRWRTHEKTVSKCCIARSSMTVRYNQFLLLCIDLYTTGTTLSLLLVFCEVCCS